MVFYHYSLFIILCSFPKVQDLLLLSFLYLSLMYRIYVFTCLVRGIAFFRFALWFLDARRQFSCCYCLNLGIGWFSFLLCMADTDATNE